LSTKDTTTFVVGNPGPGMGELQNIGSIKTVNAESYYKIASCTIQF